MTECISFHGSVGILVLGIDVDNEVCGRLVHSFNQANCCRSTVVCQNSVAEDDFIVLNVFTFVARGLISAILDDA